MAIALDDDSFRTTVAEVTRRAEELGAARDRIGREVDRLLDGGWSGVAADAFADGWVEWDTAAGDVVEALVDMAGLLEAVRVDLTGRDADSRVALGRISEQIAARLG